MVNIWLSPETEYKLWWLMPAELHKTWREIGHQWLTSVILAIWEAEIGRIVVQSQPQTNTLRDPHLQNNQSKWTGGVAQAIEWLFINLKPWVQIPVPPKNKTKKPGFDPQHWKKKPHQLWNDIFLTYIGPGKIRDLISNQDFYQQCDLFHIEKGYSMS
jgi:hypothetical protein